MRGSTVAPRHDDTAVHVLVRIAVAPGRSAVTRPG